MAASSYRSSWGDQAVSRVRLTPQGRWINSSKRRSTSWESCWKGAGSHEGFSAIAYILLLTSTQNITYLLVLLVQNRTPCARPTWSHRKGQLLCQKRLHEYL